MNKSPQIPLLTPLLPDAAALRPYLERIDQSHYYSNFGPLVNELEVRLSRLFAAQTSHPMHATTVSSATSGLELALSSLGLAPGSRVLVPALTFVASLTAIIRAGLVPVVTDIDPTNWLLTPEIARQAVMASGARAVLAVATFGLAQDTQAWHLFQQETGARVVIDAAGAFGSQWLKVADVPVVFSMHATKSLSAGEGGFLVSGNPQQNQLIRQLSNFGINLDPHADLPAGHLSHIGTNAKLSEYQAAVAHASLDQWPHAAATRAALYQNYRTQLNAACGSRIRWQAGDLPAAPTMLCIDVGHGEARGALERQCAKRGIATRRWYQPLLHQHSSAIGPLQAPPCPVAERLAQGLVGLPFSVFMTAADIEYVVDSVRHSL